MIIAEQFRGPPQSGNGGYVGGVFASLIDPTSAGATEVTLRAPIPLNKAMQTEVAHQGALVRDGETLIAEVKADQAAFIDFSAKPAPAWETVEDAAHEAYSLQPDLQDFMPGIPGYHPVCFCCGAGNDKGLRVFVAPMDDQVAGIWQTQEMWGDSDGLVPAELLWTAMDCPGQFAFIHGGVRTGLLGRMTARVLKRPRAGEALLVNAWMIRIEGKKHFAGAAIHNRGGERIAEAITLWIGNKPHPSATVTQG